MRSYPFLCAKIYLRRKTLKLNLTDYGFTPTFMQGASGGIPARVTAVHRERYELVCEHGNACAILKSGVYFNQQGEEFPTTGDFVLIDFNPSGDSRIIKTLPRKTFFSRRDPTPGHGEQAVAANFDYVFIMQSLNRDFNLKRLERYLTIAWQTGTFPAVILTKADLCDDYGGQVREARKIAKSAGVHAISAVTGQGLDELADYLKPQKTLVFLGSSGVGKSSLVNALAGESLMAVKAIREDDSRGRHTTTHRELIMLPSGVMIIDTPGMRELGLWDAGDGMEEMFGDIEQLFGQCAYSDCRHESEPNCAVKAALQSGGLPQERWESYLALKRDLSYSEDKAEYLRKKDAEFKKGAMWWRKNKSEKRRHS
jgi:ribosome biogenesis GTPase